MTYFNIYLLLLLFNVLNAVAFGAIISVAVKNIIAHNSPTHLIIYYAYTGALSLALLLSEFRTPRLLSVQMRFLSTYTGRGILLTYFGCIVYTNTLYNIIACVYTVTLGVFYLVIAWVPLVPLQHGIQYNWVRWRTEGTANMYPQDGSHSKTEQGHKRFALQRKARRNTIDNEQYLDPFLGRGNAAPGDNTQQNHREAYQHPPRELNSSNITYIPEQSQPRSTEVSHAAMDSAVSRRDSRNSNSGNRREPSIYGLSVRAESLDTTGDPYLDKVINSSRFARDMMDPSDDEYVVAHDPAFYSRHSGLASNASAVNISSPASAVQRPQSHPSPLRGEIGSGISHISPPMPYHVYSPENNESFYENLSQISRALDEGVENGADGRIAYG
ncbi:hypothetical protein GGI12_004224 [Dipsacomyces acuminosporus]|nr:hypothetical protein GGI12_004224 [Dipsacomyces acuminosporus]